MKVPLPSQIEEARRWLSLLPPGPQKDTAEGIVLTLEFMKVYRHDFYEWMAQRSNDGKK